MGEKMTPRQAKSWLCHTVIQDQRCKLAFKCPEPHFLTLSAILLSLTTKEQTPPQKPFWLISLFFFFLLKQLFLFPIKCFGFLSI